MTVAHDRPQQDRLHMPVHNMIFLSFRGLSFRIPGVMLPLFILVLFTGCELTDTNETTTSISFKTASGQYDVLASDDDPPEIDFDIVSTLRNNGSESIHLTGCQVPNRPILQKNVAGTWTTVYSVAETECISPPFVFEEDEAFTDTLFVRAFLDPDISVGAKWDNGIPIDGTYRLRRNVFESDSGFVLLDEKYRVSESFEIRVFFD